MRMWFLNYLNFVFVATLTLCSLVNCQEDAGTNKIISQSQLIESLVSSNTLKDISKATVLFITISGHTPTLMAAAAASELKKNYADMTVKLITYKANMHEATSFLLESDIIPFQAKSQPMNDSYRAMTNKLTGQSNLIGIPRFIYGFAENYLDEINDYKEVVKKYNPDLMIIDLFATSAFDFAAHTKIPYMCFYHPGTLGIIGIEDSLEYPDTLIGTSLSDQSFLTRLKRIFVFLNIVFQTSDSGDLLNQYRKQLGYPTYNDPATNIFPRPILNFGIFGIEYPRPTSPLTRFVGLFIDKREEMKASISDEDHDVINWLNSSPKPVIYVQFGTEMIPELYLLRGVIDGVLMSGHRLLMGIREDVFESIGVSRSNLHAGIPPEDFKSMPWIKSQMVLNHEKVVGFICHGGIQSTTEGIYALKPIIFLPAFADRHAVTARIVDRGIGVRLNHFTLTKIDVFNAVREISNSSNIDLWKMKMSRLIRLNQLQGEGVNGAVNEIAKMLELGDEHLQPITNDLCIFAKGGFDAIALLVTVVIIVLYIVSKLLYGILSRIKISKSKQD